MLLDLNCSANLITALTTHFVGKNFHCILLISTNLWNRLSKTFPYILKAFFNNFVPLHKIKPRGSFFYLKTGTNKLNIYFSADSPSNKLSLHMAIKEFRQDFPPAFNFSRKNTYFTLAFQFFELFILHCTF